MLQSPRATLAPGASTVWTFFALYEPDHPDASGDADLARLDALLARADDDGTWPGDTRTPVRSLLQDAAPLAGEELDEAEIAALYPDRLLEERRTVISPRSSWPMARTIATSSSPTRSGPSRGATARSCAADRACSSTRRRSAPRAGCTASSLAQLTIGNTSFHKLFSVSRDPYNITRASGLRLLDRDRITAGGFSRSRRPSTSA